MDSHTAKHKSELTAVASSPNPDAPSCHVCGKPMTMCGYQCSCGATTGCSDPVVSARAEELAREISDMFNDRGRTYDNQPTVEELAALLRSRMAELTPDIVASAGEASGYLCACDSPVAKKIGQQLRAAMLAALPSAPDTEEKV